MEQLWTASEVCKRYKWARRTLDERIAEGRFPRGRDLGGNWRWTQEDIDAYELLAGRWEPQQVTPRKRKTNERSKTTADG